jgi:hypothetical protein
MPEKEFLTLKEAAEWATKYRGRQTKPHNIAYLINYARIHTFDYNGKLRTTMNGETRISISELKNYYDNYNNREKQWKEVLGNHINWKLSFENITEAESTKHVHRLHPYKGKFIPQLVEYFLDEHKNDFKKDAFFRGGDVILDPFAGSGTTLVECMELGLHSIGIDISEFNCMITKVKTQKYDLEQTAKVLLKAAKTTTDFSLSGLKDRPESELDKKISAINKTYYPNPQFKFMIGRLRGFKDLIDEEVKLSKGTSETPPNTIEDVLYKHVKEKRAIEEEVKNLTNCLKISLTFEVTPKNISYIDDEFSSRYAEQILRILNKQTPHQEQATLKIANSELELAGLPFLSRWFTQKQRLEMQNYLTQIKKERNPKLQDLMRVILSRTIRSCRATTHSDLATLIEPQSEPYYCTKHYKICRPVTTITAHLKKYTEDTIARLTEFEKLRKNVFCEIVNADSKSLDIFEYIKHNNGEFFKVLEKKKIAGIFTSPPYVGQIDYHEQHAYAYELFGIERKDEKEIGRQAKGTGRIAQADYISGISEVLTNVKRFLKQDASIFIVANDSRNLYGKIAKNSGLHIENTFCRPVLNRTERDKQPYSESIFQMKSD